MAVASWAASTAIAVGDIRRASARQDTGLVFRCTSAGTTGSSEPAWPTDIGSTVTDNGVVWAAISSVYADLSGLAVDAIIELFELHYDSTLHGSSTILRWHAGINADITGDIVWNGNFYSRLPVKAEGFEYTNTGSLPRPTLTVANPSGAVTALLLGVNLTTPGNDFVGAQVKRIRTLKKYLDNESTADPYATFPTEIWFINRKTAENIEVVTFELASEFDLENKHLPNRQVIANICQWQYRSSECSYTGSSYYDANDNSVGSLAQDVCGKRVSSCKLRFGSAGELKFGSFPGAGLTQ